MDKNNRIIIFASIPKIKENRSCLNYPSLKIRYNRCLLKRKIDYLQILQNNPLQFTKAASIYKDVPIATRVIIL